jgi:Flp pilus assembly protein TadG
MLLRTQCSKRRTAAAAVETAFILIPIMMFFGGVFEYGRFLMTRQLVNNATREACRWALANTGSAGTNSVIQTTVYNTVSQYMAGRQTKDFASWGTSNVTCTGMQNGTSVADVTTLYPGDFITVSVTATYKFMDVIPILPMPQQVPMNSACTMIVEGGT